MTPAHIAMTGLLALAAAGSTLPAFAAHAAGLERADETATVQADPFDDLPDSVQAVALGAPPMAIWETEFTCPVGLPYLWNRDFGLRLNGTRWGTPDSRGTFIPKSTKLTTVDGLVSGWQTATFSAVTGGRIYALCTNDPAEAYAPPAASQ